MSEYLIDKSNPNVKAVFDNMTHELRAMAKSKPVVVKLSANKPKRSIQQNAYFHKLIQIIAEYQGEDLESVKRQIKHRIGLIEKHMVNGELITEIKSTASLSVDDFSKLIEQTITVCEYLNLEYPKPDAFGFDKVY